MSYHHHHHHLNTPPIIVHDHDVLSGRGVNIAGHPGNQRYRTLILTRKDGDYCEKYTTSEKRAVAEEIIKHIHSLDPPGRFLKREVGGKRSRGLSGPWLVLNHDQCVKKVCQALRDCNRGDRTGYADGVRAPEDVKEAHEKRKQSGLTNKQQAAAAAGAVAAAHMSVHPQFQDASRYGAVGSMGGVGIPAPASDADQLAAAAAMNGGRVSPTMAEAAHTLYAKRQRTEDGHVPVHPVAHEAYHPVPTHAAANTAAAAAAAAAARSRKQIWMEQTNSKRLRIGRYSDGNNGSFD
mmetsp:Transcript_28897/g.63643  ORF Transcript_28897/g.63643 Transcript_28897/m.63643 type:complete len:293 (-) Transcript_28897:402-1280(-)